ncbi:conserved hypothetical protein [Thermotomaculum hydrothermale]|uniref:L,D-TPase catalytic domain-containing protein n=1 Tax=Thermotomaculum hydrothermale TaxID=981385 RepID=A0A7R6PEI2_9BACT|nr:L,D-transpeptidase family protein [Thermotomaculum hydrothermale]BBB32223.1 conserved hypothetical protein [Thermotomaculum hydrothermale]
MARKILSKNFKKFLIFLFIFLITPSFAITPADMVVVKKSEHRLYLMKNGKVIKSYHVVFGKNPKGHKIKEGDSKTPEGLYVLDYKNLNSKFYKSIHISYPNKQDIERARKLHVNPGGDIMIHGQKNGWEMFSFIMQRFNWTRGCIALSNKDMDEVWKSVKVGTPIKILP